MEIAAARVARVLPDLRVKQAFFKSHMGRPDNVHLAVDQTARQLSKERRRIGFVGKVEMLGAVLILTIPDLVNDFLDLLRPVARRIALAMVAELAAAPVTASRG